MIVVAIIGILAAVAIPGFMQYIKNSKTSEAKTNLDAVKTGAISYFETEHYDSTGMNASTKEYPSSTKTGAQPTLGTAPTASTIGTKFSPVDATNQAHLKAIPWTQLNFTISSPFYYYYNYAEATSEGLSRFQAKASASLNEALDSVFYINGYSDGTASAVVDISEDASKTSAATAPTKDPKDAT